MIWSCNGKGGATRLEESVPSGAGGKSEDQGEGGWTVSRRIRRKRDSARMMRWTGGSGGGK